MLGALALALVVVLVPFALSDRSKEQPPRDTDDLGAAPVADEDGAALGLAAGGSLQYQPAQAVAADLDAFEASGAPWVRVDVHWSAVQEGGPDAFDWTAHDVMIEAARARGLRVLAMIGYTPEWASGEADDKFPPRDPADFGRFCRAAAERYGPRDVRHWEVWNEPNIAGFWQPAADVDAYAAVLEACSEGIRGVDDEAVVITGGTAPARNSADSVAPVTWVRGLYAAGAGEAFDAVGHHPYTWPNDTRERSTDSAWWVTAGTRRSIRSTMRENGDGHKRVWATEFGAPTSAVGDENQERILRQAWQEWSARAWAGPLFWYQLHDEGRDPDDDDGWFGLLRPDGSAKPAYDTFRRLAEAGP